uniref:Uncharacterized protein n=2 Tax=Lygus hesperus TaxID=30085 RepID=A0A0A9WS05_LYGHE
MTNSFISRISLRRPKQTTAPAAEQTSAPAIDDTLFDSWGHQDILANFYETTLSYHALTGLRRSRLQKSIQKYLPIQVKIPGNTTYLAGKPIEEDRKYERDVGTNVFKPIYIFAPSSAAINQPQKIAYIVIITTFFMAMTLALAVAQVVAPIVTSPQTSGEVYYSNYNFYIYLLIFLTFIGN